MVLLQVYDVDKAPADVAWKFWIAPPPDGTQVVVGLTGAIVGMPGRTLITMGRVVVHRVAQLRKEMFTVVPAAAAGMVNCTADGTPVGLTADQPPGRVPQQVVLPWKPGPRFTVNVPVEAQKGVPGVANMETLL